MKIRVKFLCLLGIISSFCVLYDANATTDAVTCPAGAFCTSGGKYVSSDGGIRAHMLTPATLVTPGYGDRSDDGFCATNCSTDRCTYCAEDYDEVWMSEFLGFYLVKNGDVMYHSIASTVAPGMFTCPGSYPSSAPGASSVFECYRVVANGQKEYYKTPTNTQINSSGNYDINNITVLVNNLQSALDQANKIAKDLQATLNKSKSNNITDADRVNRAKKLINSGITDTSIKSGKADDSVQIQKQVSKSTLSKSATRSKK